MDILRSQNTILAWLSRLNSKFKSFIFNLAPSRLLTAWSIFSVTTQGTGARAADAERAAADEHPPAVTAGTPAAPGRGREETGAQAATIPASAATTTAAATDSTDPPAATTVLPGTGTATSVRRGSAR